MTNLIFRIVDNGLLLFIAAPFIVLLATGCQVDQEAQLKRNAPQSPSATSNSPQDKITSEIDDSEFIVFDGEQFESKKARMWAVLPDPFWCDQYNRGKGKTIIWAVEITTARIGNRESWPPIFDLSLDSSAIADWLEIENHQIDLANTGDKLHDFDNQPIVNGQLNIIKRDGGRFLVRANGAIANGKQFKLQCWTTFEGIICHANEKDDVNIIQKRLAQQLSLANLLPGEFKLEEHSYTNGLRMARMDFKPQTQSQTDPITENEKKVDDCNFTDGSSTTLLPTAPLIRSLVKIVFCVSQRT